MEEGMLISFAKLEHLLNNCKSKSLFFDVIGKL